MRYPYQGKAEMFRKDIVKPACGVNKVCFCETFYLDIPYVDVRGERNVEGADRNLVAGQSLQPLDKQLFALQVEMDVEDDDPDEKNRKNNQEYLG
jgi:hypothetical protein